MDVLRKDLRAINADGAAANVMVGIGENYLPAFVLAISASQLASGLVATVPMVMGAVLQMAAPYALRRLGSYRGWVVLCAVVQAAVFVPLVVAALLGGISVVGVFIAVSIYWATGLASGSAWNTWVDTLVPRRVRTRYFACRTRLTQIGLVSGFVVGGLALQVGARRGEHLTFFALLFTVALLSRLVSASFLHSQREPVRPSAEVHSLGVGDLLRVLRMHTAGRTLLYLLGAQMAVQISGPYFTPYMLSQLKLSYAAYVVLICAAYLSKIACLPALGRLADRWGADRLLWIGAVAIVPVAGLWAVSDSFLYLCGVQLLSGAAWGAYELAMLLLFFETIPAPRRVGVLTVFNLANSTAILLGSLVGGALLMFLGANREAYLVLFGVSTSARAVALLLLTRLPQHAAIPTSPAITLRTAESAVHAAAWPAQQLAPAGRRAA